MNKKVLLTITCMIFSLGAIAQEPLSIGFRGGLNFSSVVGGDVEEGLDYRTGFQAGFLTEFYLTRDFGIQGEVIYSEQGFGINEDTNGDDQKEEVRFNLNYINIPIMLKYYITNNLCAELGPQIGVNISAKQEIIDGPIGAGNEKIDLENVKLIDFSGGVGLSYKFDEGFFFQGRYLLGISTIDLFESIDDESLDIRHSVFQVSAGFRF